MTSYGAGFTLGIVSALALLGACGESSRSAESNSPVAGSSGSSAAAGGNMATGGAGGKGGAATGGAGASGGTTGGSGGASGGKGGSAGSANDAGKGGSAGTSGGSGGSAGPNPDGGVGGSLAGAGGNMSGSGGAAGATESCEGFPDPVKMSCTRAGGCENIGYCRFPGDPQPCGTFCFAESGCASDDDCPDGVCDVYPASCCPEGTYSTQCRPRCTETSCGEGRQCGEDGRCSCVDELCPPNQECRPGPTGGMICQRRLCDDDDQCDCGGCFEGSCTPPPDVGVCELPVP